MSLLYFVGAAIFAVGGAHTALTSGEWFGWGGLIFFGACAAFYLWDYFDTKPQILIDDRGIDDFNTGFGLYAWQDIERAFTVPLISQIIFLDLSSPEKYLEGFSPARQKWIKVDTAAMPSKFRVDLTGMQASRDDVYQLIIENLETFRRANKPSDTGD